MKIVADDNLQRRQLKTYEEGKLYMIGRKILKCDVPGLADFFNKARDRIATCLQIAATMDEVLDEQEGIKDAVELRNNIVKNMKEPHLALVTQVKDKSDRLELLKMIADNKPMPEITDFAKASVINGNGCGWASLLRSKLPRARLRARKVNPDPSPEKTNRHHQRSSENRLASVLNISRRESTYCPSDLRERIEFLEKLDVARAIKEMYEREEQIVSK